MTSGLLSDDLPDWLQPGSEVTILRPTRSGTTGKVTPTTVDRVLKRDIVLANGERFRRSDLLGSGDHCRRNSGSAWDPSTLLVPRGHGYELAMRAANGQVRRSAAVHTAYGEWRRARTVDAAEALRVAVGNWVDGDCGDGAP